jgi:hypothetical protein
MLFDSRDAFEAALDAIDQRDGFGDPDRGDDVTTSWAAVLCDAAGRYVVEVPPDGVPDGLGGYTIGQPTLPCAVVP